MAAEVLSNISTALATTFAPQIERIWNRQAVFAQNVPLKPGGGQGGGKQVAWDVEYSGATAQSFAEGSAVANGELTTDPVTVATLPWGQYRSAFQLSNLEINAAASNVANATALEDMVGERFLGAITKLISVINADLFTGTGTDGSGNPNIIGLNSALAATGSYATINKGTVTEWAGNVSANGGIARSLSMNLLAASEQLAFVSSGMEPDMLLSTAGVHTKYEGLFEATRRTVDSGQGPIPAYQGSTGRLYWRGKPVLRDRNATTGYLYMLNMSELELVYLPWAGMPDGIMNMTRGLESSNGRDASPTPIMARCYPLGRVGSGVAFVVEIYLQLKVRRPNAHVMIQDINES